MFISDSVGMNYDLYEDIYISPVKIGGRNADVLRCALGFINHDNSDGTPAYYDMSNSMRMQNKTYEDLESLYKKPRYISSQWIIDNFTPAYHMKAKIILMNLMSKKVQEWINGNVGANDRMFSNGAKVFIYENMGSNVEKEYLKKINLKDGNVLCTFDEPERITVNGQDFENYLMLRIREYVRNLFMRTGGGINNAKSGTHYEYMKPGFVPAPGYSTARTCGYIQRMLNRVIPFIRESFNEVQIIEDFKMKRNCGNVRCTGQGWCADCIDRSRSQCYSIWDNKGCENKIREIFGNHYSFINP